MKCSVDDCNNDIRCTEFCSKHYARYRRNGSPLKFKSVIGENRKKHPLYSTYHRMLCRCSNPNYNRYHHYGGRGIKVCNGWLGHTGFNNFIKDMGERPEGKGLGGRSLFSLDRIDNDGNYSCGHCEECVANSWPANCRWATSVQQGANQQPRRNKHGYPGAYKHHGKYRSTIKVQGKVINLGRFNTPEEASKAYIEAKEKRDKLYRTDSCVL